MTSVSKNCDLVSLVRTTITDYGMIHPGDIVVAGVSGGPDSMALLTILYHLTAKMGFSLIVAHVDHRLRPESHGDALFVKQVAEQLGIPVRVTEVDANSIAVFRRRGTEEAGRRIRYEFFEEVRTSSGAHKIATAHHADDATETFFLRILTGAGSQGLTGIAPVRGSIIRPLIHCYRKDILAFLEERSISYRIDRTNLEPDTDRNFLRNTMFPQIARRFPHFRKPLARTLDLIRDDAQLIASLAAQLRSRSVSGSGNETVLDVPLLRQAPRQLATRAILDTLYDLPESDERWAKVHADIILRMVHGANPSARADLPGGIVLIREYSKIRLLLEPPIKPTPFSVLVSGPGRVRAPETDMVLELRVTDRASPEVTTLTAPEHCSFDAENASFPLVLRSPQPGDKFKPWGFSGTRKLKKVLIDLKIPVLLRARWPLLVKDHEILWIPGIRRSSLAPVGPRTERVLHALIRDAGSAAPLFRVAALK
jgi:tRNA(Ile)-lysidine synthase